MRSPHCTPEHLGLLCLWGLLLLVTGVLHRLLEMGTCLGTWRWKNHQLLCEGKHHLVLFSVWHYVFILLALLT